MISKVILKKVCHTMGVRCYSNRNMMKLKDRGMLQDIFPQSSAQEITDLCNASSQCVYAGFDPTAPSLHVGNLLILSSLIHWQRGGHKVIALVGGATGQVGDPSGRTKEREVQKYSLIKENVLSISKLIKRIFENHEKYFWKDKDKLVPIMVVDNEEWYKEIGSVEFVAGVGRLLRMGTLLSRASVESRLASPAGMSFAEFAYQLFQANDWLHLFNKYNCRFQIGGSDQMGNIMTGQELISRVHNTPVYGMTCQLVTSEEGDKYGKSAGNAVWLDSKLTSPFSLLQFFLRTPDHQLSQLLPLFTFLPTQHINDLLQQHSKKPELRKGQKVLAEAVTLLVHGEEGLQEGKRVTEVIYGSSREGLATLSLSQIEEVFRGAVQVSLALQPGITLRDMTLAAKCFLTLNDAERIIRGGGLYINHERARDPDEVIVPGVHILPNDLSIVRIGKRNYWIIKWLK